MEATVSHPGPTIADYDVYGMDLHVCECSQYLLGKKEQSHNFI